MLIIYNALYYMFVDFNSDLLDFLLSHSLYQKRRIRGAGSNSSTFLKPLNRKWAFIITMRRDASSDELIRLKGLFGLRRLGNKPPNPCCLHPQQV
jgi:hypothetical protein